jgi:pyruvate kinase
MNFADGYSSRSPQNAAERRAKIVCTIGPACNSEEALADLMRLGMDVARLNFSHGTHDSHAQTITRLRKVAAQLGRTICILQDLQGPKIRTGRLRDHTPVMLEPGSRVTITNRDVEGTSTLLATTFTTLAKEVEPGARILLSDGRLSLKVVAIHGDDLECEVVDGGLLGEHQGINLPGTVVSVPSLTEKDLDDLRFGVQQGVDAVALSFVRTAADVRHAKNQLSALGADTPVIAKLEKPQAIDNLEEILGVTDCVMVARGDLGVEVLPEKVPSIQKHVIRRAQVWRRPVITATQMLESMIENPRPTRAEASDVANAIFDGTDAVMLSGETASGKYPREAVSMMSRIVVEAEAHAASNAIRMRHDVRDLTIAEAICESVAHLAEDLKLSAIAVFTETGDTARLISEYRPRTPVYAFSQEFPVRNRLNLYWGVHPVGIDQAVSLEQMTSISEDYLVSRGVTRKDEVFAIVAGTRATKGSTNFIRLRQVQGEPLLQAKQ